MLVLLVGILEVFGWQNHFGDQHVKSDLTEITTDSILTVNRVLIIGNKVTKEKIISRELSLKPGDTVSRKRLDQVITLDRRKIYNLRLFNTVSIQALRLGENSIDLLVEVSERWYTFPVPIFELSDRNFNEWWQNYNHSFRRVNYGLRLYQYNFRGRNETLRLTGQLGFTRRLDLNYKIPYIDKKQKQGLIFDVNYAEPKNMAYFTDDHKLVFLKSPTTARTSKGASVTYTYRRSFYETHGVSLGYVASSVLDTVALLNPNYYGKEGKTSLAFGTLSYSFISEHRDVIAYPLKGYQFTGFIQKNGIGIGDKVSQWEMNLTYAKHADLKRNWYLSNFSSLYLSTANAQPYALYGALGYRKLFVRGYEIYLIEGPNFFLNKTTLKKKLFSHAWHLDDMPFEQFRYFPIAIYLKAYADWGYVENYPYYEKLGINTRLSDRLLASAGAGIDLVLLYDTVLRFEYTFTRENIHGFFFNVKKEF